MNAIKEQTIKMVQILVRAWDPDFTKTTSSEKKAIDSSAAEMQNGIYFNEEDVWN